MFGLDLKLRKLTTYGKPGRQQGLGFKSFLENSPEKRKSQSDIQASPQKPPYGPSRDDSKEAGTWDVPSDDNDDGIARPAQLTKARERSSTLQKSKPGISAGQAKTRAPVANRTKVSAKEVDAPDEAAFGKRKRDVQKDGSKKLERDIFEIPDDMMITAPSAPSVFSPLPSRSRAKTPTGTTSTGPNSIARSRSTRNTPEPPHLRSTPLTARKIGPADDIYDVPDDDEAIADRRKDQRTGHRVSGPTSPLPARKRQKTPARDMRTEDKVISKVRSGATIPQHQRPIMSSQAASIKQRSIASPKLSKTSGIVKRKLAKGASAPASLFSMIREPPSPPADSSDSAASPTTPDVTSEMELEPAMTPATPPNRASVSPAAIPGSVTPRQKQLWSQLLGGNSTDSPSELPMSKLQLTSAVKASSQKVASLTRSASDVPQSSHSRRSRLIDSLKATSTISEADEMDVDELFDRNGEASIEGHFSSSIKGKRPKLQSEVSFRKTSTKVTYGQGRTYLEEQNEEKMWDMLAAEEPSQGYGIGGSHGQAIADDDEEMEGASQPRAAHDLRTAGTRRRLHDELSMILMDVEQRTNSVAIRRSALRDLAEKLIEKEAAACFLESGLDNSFLKAVEKDTDNVFLFLEAAIIVLLVSAGPTSSVLDHIFQSPVFSNIFKLLDLNASLERVVRDKKSNLAKMSQSMILEFRDQLFLTEVWGDTKPRSLTPRILGLQSIEMVVHKLREHGSSYTLLDEPTVQKILDIASTEMAYTSPDVAVIEVALSALQVNTVSSPMVRHKIWPSTLTQTFAELLPGVFTLPDGSASMSIQLALKLAVELTNHNAAACDVIGTPAIIEPLLRNANERYTQLLNHMAGATYNVAFDFTVLSFGLTINLTEASDQARLAMLHGDGASLDETISLFIRGRKRAEDAESLEDTQMNVIYGCVAFTLGNLSRNPVLRKIIAGRFGGNLNMVLEAMQEFAAINRLTDKKEFEGEEGHEVSKSFTARLQTVLEEIRALNT